MFTSYPSSLYAKNINSYTLAELTSNTTETPYPNLDINTPPMGRVNSTTTPSSTVNSQDKLIAVQGITIDAKDRLWLLDVGRVIDSSGMLLPSSVGGPKLVGVDLTTDSVVQTITFSSDVATSLSYLNDLRIDLRPSITSAGQGVAYITDSSANGVNGIITVDLGTGESWRHLDGDQRVRGTLQHYLSVWGETVYRINSPTMPITFDYTGSDGIALSADGETLFWSVTGSRNLFSIPTARLRDNSQNSEIKAQASVLSLGQKGVSDGIDADSNDKVYMGDFQQNAISVYDSETSQVSQLVRDPRIGWTDAVLAGLDGYLYFNENQLWRTPGHYPDGKDRTTRPLPLFRVPLPDGGKGVRLQ